MSGRRWMGWLAGLFVAFTTMGCCRFCDRWCGAPPPPVCCPPVCCPPVCCPAPAHYQPQPQPQPQGQTTSWSQPRGNCCQ